MPTAPIRTLFIEDEFTVTSNGQTTFTLSQTPDTQGPFVLLVNSAAYAEGTDFTVVGTLVTWLDTDFTLQIGDHVVVVYREQ